jgi:hypothetical protein
VRLFTDKFGRVEVAVVLVAVIYATVGLVEALIVVPFEFSHPCPNDVWPVPPFAMPRVPVVEARGTVRFKEEVAVFTQLVPLYDMRLP